MKYRYINKSPSNGFQPNHIYKGKIYSDKEGVVIETTEDITMNDHTPRYMKFSNFNSLYSYFKTLSDI